MPGTALENFTDFIKATGPTYLTGPDRLINEAVKRTYILSRLLRGRDLDKTVQGGRTINDDLMFDDASTYQHYKPNSTFTWRMPQVMTETSIPWRFSLDHMAWTDQEIELNISAGMTRAAQKVQYKRLKKKIEQRMWTSMINGFEDDIWASGHDETTSMESTDGDLPYSIPSMVNEETNGLANGWTTKQGIAPATEDRWRPQQVGYDSSDPDGSTTPGTALIPAFDEMWLKAQFVPPNVLGKGQHFEDLSLQVSRQMCCCSLAGQILYKRMLRDSNDTLVSKQDPAYNNPKYSGVDVIYVAALDAAALYTDGASAYVAEASANDTGPRYYWLNGNYITPVWHTTRYFYKKAPMVHPNQPYTTICPVDSWWNVFTNSLQRQGIISPII